MGVFQESKSKFEFAIEGFSKSSYRDDYNRNVSLRTRNIEESLRRGNEEEQLTRLSTTYWKEEHENSNLKVESIESLMINTVVGTGLILWVVQGAQLAATLISAAPAWIQLDPLAVMQSTDDKKPRKEDIAAGEKLFE